MSVPADRLDITRRIGTLDSLRLTQADTTIAGGALTLDLGKGSAFRVPLTENVASVLVSGASQSGVLTDLLLLFTADGTARTVAWPTITLWAGGVAPTLTGTAGKIDIIRLLTFDGGMSWFGSVIGQAY